MTDVQELYQIPDKWIWTRLEDVIDSMRNGIYKPIQFYETSGTPCLRMYNIENGQIIWKDIKRMRLTPGEKEFYELKEGDLLVNRVNSRELVGKAAVIPENLEKCVYESKNIRVRLLGDAINSKFVNLWFLIYSRIFFSRNAQQVVGMASISQPQIASMPIPLAPRNEQERIVGKVEELFSFLDAGVASLRAVQAQLKRYRQAVLKAAFEGKLTEHWREVHKAKIEYAQRLLKRPDQITQLNMPRLPESWRWVKLSEIGTLDRGKSKHRPRDDKKLFGGDYPFIQTGNVRNSNGIITNYSQTYNETGLKQSKIWPVNTLCITIAANIAETALLGLPACFPDSIVGFTAREDTCEVKYVHFFLKSAKDKLASFAPATAQKNINLAILRNLFIPLASLQEQHKIVEEFERLFSIADETENTIQLSLKQSEHLRQSVLQAAFNGGLVPQDPTDEPAEKLLERIKVERLSNKSKNNQVELSQYVE